MKKLSFILILIFAVLLSNAQLVNVNPDKTAEPWIAGGWKIPNSSELEKIRQIPELKIDVNRKSKDLPSSLDNSENQYFRPIFSQTDGCCAQASGIAYNYTYEMNRIRDTYANAPDNQYPTHYTYNFLNAGSGENGSWFWDGWDIVAANGCPTIAEYGGLYQDANYWMSGYDAYQDGMENRVVEQFSIDVSTPEGLEDLKYWFYNHGDDSETGGIVNFAAGVTEEFSTSQFIVHQWGSSVNHAMTFVGWDDNIQYDFNNDGQYTNNVDINDDGVVDMKDWEIGAVIMVNSWGEWWENSGKAYVMYKLLAEPVSNGGIFENKVYSINVRETYTPSAIMKVKMSHNVRNMVEIKAGVSTNLSATTPDYEVSFPIFNNQGGEHNMRGDNSSPIEITLDITQLLSYFEAGEDVRFFLAIDESDDYGYGSGEVVDFSVTDVETGDEYISDMHNISVVDNDVTYLWTNGSIDFDAPVIETNILENGIQYDAYSQDFLASGGVSPYNWGISLNYEEEVLSASFPNITSTQLTPNSNDDGFALQDLEFDFPFYGQSYNQLFVSTDGSLLFDQSFTYLRNEEAIASNKTISVFASDLMIYPEYNDGLFYEGDENSATFRWATSLYDQPDVNVNVAVTIYPSGEIELFYGEGITNGLSWASGISDGSGHNYTIADISNANNPSNSELQFVSQPFPLGMEMSETGIFSGTPTQIGTWDINFVVTDFNNISKIEAVEFTVEESQVNIENTKNENSIICFPNPFTKNTTIEFNLPQTQKVKLEIYDIRGVKINTLINNELEKGNHQITFENNNLQEGIYFVKLVTNNNVLVEEIIFVK